MPKGNQHFEYEDMPQDDKGQIEQIVRDYTNDSTAKGLAHGVQKDAIQNGWGARLHKDAANACKDWAFHFELKDIQGTPALIFWDEGTFGLTGEIHSPAEIQALSASGGLGAAHPNERLSRFLTRFVSGGNIGPGAYGRGKLIFQGASKDLSIIVDSLRKEGDYIAFGRTVIENRIKQTRPVKDDAAKEFMKTIAKGALKPLERVGSRITILNVHQEIIDAFVRSFEDEKIGSGYSDTLSKMIEETWWEVISFGAKIYLHRKSTELQVKLADPLLSLTKAKDKDRGVRVHERNNITIQAGNESYRIKTLRLAVFPEAIDEDLREIWVQRKRMKIGSISRHIRPHPQIDKRLAGYLILEEDLEDKVLEWENLTHYGFSSLNTNVMRSIRDAIRTELNKFQEHLGFRTVERTGAAKQEMLDMLKELNETAKDLGLLTDLSTGPRIKGLEVSIKSMVLPNPGSIRVDIGQKLRLFKLAVNSNSSVDLHTKLIVHAIQGDRPPLALFEKEIEIKANGVWSHTISSISLTNPPIQPGAAMSLRVRLYNAAGDPIDQTSRTLWIGIDPPHRLAETVTVLAYEPEMPRITSRRVEPDESIKKIRFRICNRTGQDLSINVRMEVRKAKTRTEDIRKLMALVDDKSTILPALGEIDCPLDELKIDPVKFGAVLQEPPTAEQRKCEIFFGATAAKGYPDLAIIQAERLGGRRTIPFFLSVDPPGSSIFKDVKEAEALPTEGKRSWIEGDRASGYIFFLNIKHPSYIALNDAEKDMQTTYIREQMLIQAYIIALREGSYSGPAEKFRAEFSSSDLSPGDAVACFDELIGRALNKESWAK